MSVREIASTSLIRMKEVSTSIFHKVTKRLHGIKFIERNKKCLVVCTIIWFTAVLAGSLVWHSAATRLKDDFYQKGVSTVQDLGAKIGRPLLENDTLALTGAIGEIDHPEILVFTAILDHKDKVIAHTDAQMVNEPFTPLRHAVYLDAVDTTSIESGIYADTEEAIAFYTDVRFSGIKIGKVYLALRASTMNRTLNRYGMFLICEVLLSLLVLSGIVWGVDRRKSAKKKKLAEEFARFPRIGPYILHHKIAQGGMAELFLADYVREDGFCKTVAVKRVLPHLAENKEFIAMFIREARVAAVLQHPNVVQILDFGKIANAHFIAMEFIRGKNLAEVLSVMGEGLPVDLAVFVMSQVGVGLEYSHNRKDDKSGEPLNIVHRDISPQNILISYQGEVKISDFGISKARSEPSLTQAGVIKGKLAYLSPEQALGKPADQQSDIYSLGIVFYEMLSGKKLYHFKTAIDALRIIPEKEIVPIMKLRPEIPDELNHIVMKCLEKDKTLRYRSVGEIHEDLTHLKTKLRITYDLSDLAGFMKKHFKKEEKI